MAHGASGHYEYEYDLQNWKETKVYSGGSTEFWEDFRGVDKDDPKRVWVHPRMMTDYQGLQDQYQRDLFTKACSMEGETYLEVLKLQEDLKFHFYYTGVDPEDGTDEPKVWLGLVVYDKRNLPSITKGLKKIGVDIENSPEDELDKNTAELSFQMMLRSSDAWITYCDPWLKKVFKDPEHKLKKGTVYNYEGDVVKGLLTKEGR